MKRFLYCTRLLFLLSAGFLLLFSACKKESDKYPKLVTLEPELINSNTILFKGRVDQVGDYTILDYGFLYGQNTDLQDSLKKLSLGNQPATGEFSKDLTSIVREQYPSKDYFSVQSYITTDQGDFYGEQMRIDLPAMSASSITPKMGKAGDLITIEGDFFIKDVTSVKVLFGDFPAVIKQLDDHKIVVQVPDEISKVSYPGVNITLQVNGESFQFTPAFYILPNYKDFFPKSGPLGTRITFVGDNIPLYLSGAPDIYLNDILVPADTSHHPAGFVIPRDFDLEHFGVYIVWPDSPRVHLGDFTVTPPTIEPLGKTSFSAGEEIFIYGSGYHIYGDVIVKAYLDNIELQTSYQGPNGLALKVPENIASGQYTLKITNGKQTEIYPDKLTITQEE